MSVLYCEYCHTYIDTDYNAEHFTDAEGLDYDKCIEQIEYDKDE